MQTMLSKVLDAHAVWMTDHGHRPREVHLSSAAMTAAVGELHAMAGFTPTKGRGVIGFSDGMHWYVDKTLAGDEFRFV